MAAADNQTMLKKVQETDYQTSMEEQREVEGMGWDINFPPGDTFMNPVNAEVDSVQDQLTRRATNGELSEAEATRQLRTFAANSYERGMRQLMALYDLWKRKHFPMFVTELYRLSVSIDGANEALKTQRAKLDL